MGGRGASSSVKVFTEEEYLTFKGYPFMGYSDPAMQVRDIRESKRTTKQLMTRYKESAEKYDTKRAELRKEYQKLIKQGKIRKPTVYEQMLKTAKGNPELRSTQAAKRMLKKIEARGIKK